jgi:hypothetical protein
MAIGDPICTSQAANPESSFSFLGQIWTIKDIATLFPYNECARVWFI